MEIIKFLIVTNDKDYGEALCKCARNIDTNISFSYSDVFCGEDKNVLRKNNDRYSMIILDGMSDEEEKKISEENKSPVCYLTDNPEKATKLPERKETIKRRDLPERTYVYKYNKLSQVITELMDYFTLYTGNSAGRIFSGTNECKLYSVTSSMGGQGATSIAMGLAEDLAFAGGNRTLYLSLGEYHQELNFSKSGSGRNLREYLYDFFYGNRSFCDNIQGYLTTLRDNLYMFNVSRCKSEYSCVNDKQFTEFIDYLMEKNFFDRIIVDIGTNVREKWNCVYKIASCNILMNSLMDSWYQEQFWMEYYKKAGKINDRTLIVENRFFKGEEAVSGYSSEGHDEFLPEDNVVKEKTGAGRFAGYISGFGKENHWEKKNESHVEVPLSRKRKKNKVRIPEDRDAFIRADGFVNINLDTGFGQGIREMVLAMADLSKIN